MTFDVATWRRSIKVAVEPELTRQNTHLPAILAAEEVLPVGDDCWAAVPPREAVSNLSVKLLVSTFYLIPDFSPKQGSLRKKG